ncbi:hypothetical protein EYF80_021212 [Liparis tanakae]|uniref:Uncharacterized protein n=1 Tax=Liparis tanakae TaxID=230148 RepID=A0A4Z2HRV5_9TELE|nr:hypothetical protein EYF80_021212 [Liparis tanakae]
MSTEAKKRQYTFESDSYRKIKSEEARLENKWRHGGMEGAQKIKNILNFKREARSHNAHQCPSRIKLEASLLVFAETLHLSHYSGMTATLREQYHGEQDSKQTQRHGSKNKRFNPVLNTGDPLLVTLHSPDVKRTLLGSWRYRHQPGKACMAFAPQEMRRIVRRFDESDAVKIFALI